MGTRRCNSIRSIPVGSAVAIALALAAQAAAAQDTGMGTDLSFGTKLDPSGWSSLYGCSDEGTSWLTPFEHRTPTGYLYHCPPQQPQGKAIGEWLYSGTVSLGYLGVSGSNEENANWQRYSDWDDGLILDLAHLSAIRPSDGSYIDFRGSRLGDDNQFYKFTGGRAGSYRIDAFYREIPNVVSANAKSIWDGIGTDHLTLAPGLVPAGSTPEQVAAVSEAAPERRLQVTREKAGVGINYYFNTRWTGMLNLSNEDRKGARPYGGPFFFNYPFPSNGGILEVPRPINDSTTNLNTALRFVGSLWRSEFAYSGSFYRSKYTGYDYQMPFGLYPVVPGAASAQLTLGQFSSEPDNDYHSLRVNVSRRLPMNGDLSVTASASRMRQNDDLLAPINCQGNFGIDLSPTGSPVNPFLFNCADWNTTAALSRRTGDLTIDSQMLFARLVLQPAMSVTLRADARFRKEDYQGDYIAYNPLTGDYGYIAENGAQGSVVPGEVGFWNAATAPSNITRFRNVLLDKSIAEAHLGADWRLDNYNTLGATYGFTRTDRDHRERAATDDNELRLTWVNRRIDWLTLRANYTYLRQTGDPYNFDPYEYTFTTSLPGYVPGAEFPHTVADMRKYDVSSRTQNKFELMGNAAVGDDMTVNLSFKGDFNDYDARIGRQGYDVFSTTLQWEWQPSPDTVTSIYYGYERARIKQANVNEGATTQADDPVLGGASYPLAGLWWADDTQTNHNFGATLDQKIGRARLEASWNYTNSRGVTGYSFASATALAYADVADLTGNEFPAMIYRVNALNVGIRYPLSANVSVRLFDYYERGTLRDWHYLGFDQTRVYDHRVYTDGGPEDYSDNLLGLTFEVRL